MKTSYRNGILEQFPTKSHQFHQNLPSGTAIYGIVKLGGTLISGKIFKLRTNVSETTDQIDLI